MSPIDPIWLPFTAAQLRRHLRATGDEDPLRPYLEAAAWYRELTLRHPDRRGLALQILRAPCGIESDPRFWTASCLMSFVYGSDPASNLAVWFDRAFSAAPPDGWRAALAHGFELELTSQLPPSRAYAQAFRGSNSPIPFVHDAMRPGRVEPPAYFEATITSRDATVIVLARVLGDIRTSTDFDVTRNELARIIDAVLDPPADPHAVRHPDRTWVLMITPRTFLDAPETRFYGWTLRAYRHSAAALGRALPHRSAKSIDSFRTRLGWTSWEDADAILPGSCGWLRRSRAQ